MFEIFNGNDLQYLRQYNAIQNIIMTECEVEITAPQATERYVYWSHPSGQAQGGAVLEYDANLKHYRLMHIAFHMEEAVFAILGERGEEYVFDSLITEFYQGIYLKFREICKGHDNLIIQLHALEVQDSIKIGRWQYLDLRVTDHPEYWEGIVDIGSIGRALQFQGISQHRQGTALQH